MTGKDLNKGFDGQWLCQAAFPFLNDKYDCQS